MGSGGEPERRTPVPAVVGSRRRPARLASLQPFDLLWMQGKGSPIAWLPAIGSIDQSDDSDLRVDAPWLLINPCKYLGSKQHFACAHGVHHP